MTPEQISIEEGNKLIAEFMGGFMRDMGHGDMIWDHAHYMSPLICKYPSELEYHSSWDWLMPVIEKIEAFGLLFRIGGIDCELLGKGVEDDDNLWLQKFPDEGFYTSDYKRTKISCAWDVVVQFIQWYNTQKQ